MPRGVSTGPDGRFSFRQLTGEQFSLSAEKEGYHLSPQGEEHGLQVKPGMKDLRVVLVREASVHGRLIQADGSPLPRFQVNGQEQEDEEGRFFLPILRTGTLQLELSAPGFKPVRRSVAVQEEIDVDLGTITLAP